VTFAYDSQGFYGGNTLYFVSLDDPTALGVLNSSAVEFFYKSISSQIRGDFLRFFTQFVAQVPIPAAPADERAAIERLVRRLLALRGAGDEAAALEAALNARVYRLFGLTAEEIAVIEAETKA
jgi:hypothetical protein